MDLFEICEKHSTMFEVKLSYDINRFEWVKYQFAGRTATGTLRRIHPNCLCQTKAIFERPSNIPCLQG